jgi:tetratricopeptide (TPR) repeat protein
MKEATKVVKIAGGNKAPRERGSFADTCKMVSKMSLYLLAFLLPIMFLPWTANVLDFNKQALLVFLVFISVFAWLLNVLISGRVRINISLVHIPVGVLFLVYLVSTIFSSWRYGSFWGWPLVTSESLITIICLVLLYFLVVNMLERKETFHFLAFTVFSSGIAALYGALQVLGVYIIPIGFTKSQTFNSLGSVNMLAITAAAILPLAIMMIIASKKKTYRILFGISAAVFAAILLIINFYIAWWLVIAGSALIFIFGMQRRDLFDSRWLILPMFFLAVGLLFAFFRFSIPGLPQMPVEYSLKQGPSLQIVTKVLQENPVIGTGPGTFSYVFERFKDISFNQSDLWNSTFSWASSRFLTVLATVGALGGLAMIAVLAAFLIYGVLFLFRKKEMENYSFNWSLSLGAFISFIVISVSYFLYSSNLTLDFVYFALVASFMALVYPDKKEFELKPSSLITLMFTFAITVVFVFGLGLFILEGQRYVSSVDYLSGVTLWQTNQTESALTKLERAASISPGVDVYWREIAQAYLNNISIVANDTTLSDQDKRQAVQSSINKAVNAGKVSSDTNPADVANWSARGFVYQNMIGTVGGTKDWAVESYKEAIKLDPTNPFYPTQAGISILANVALLGDDQKQEKEDELNQAADFFNQAIQLKSDYAPAHFQLARVYLAQGKQDEMVQSLENAKAAAPFDVGLAFQLGLVYYQKQDYQKAKTELERAVVLNPNYANALYFLGLTYYQLGQKDSAISVFEKILQLNPGHELATQVLANMKAGRDALAGVSQTGTNVPIDQSAPEQQPGDQGQPAVGE